MASIHSAPHIVDNPIPQGELWLVAVQHAVLVLAFLVYPLAAAQHLQLTEQQTTQFITACILAVGVATVWHSVRQPWGSGVLAVEVPTPIFLPATILVGSAGGLGAIAAMSLVSGVVGLMFARLLRWIRVLFPAEVCGVAVIMLGVSLVRPGMSHALGLQSPPEGPNGVSLAIALATLVTIVAIAVYAQNRLRLLALALGLLAGLAASWVLGELDTSHWEAMQAEPWLGWPDIAWVAPQFSLEWLPLCLVMGLVLSVDNIGMLVSIQRQYKPDWQRIDYRQASAGVSTSSVGDLVAGAFGGMPTGISSANISLAAATGLLTRRIALITGLVLLLTAFTPRFVFALTLIPKPVIGAVMVYAAAYMVVSGMSLFLTRLLSQRRVFVIGLALVLGLTPALLPGVFAQTPQLIRPILESPLALGTFSAMLLVVVFRFGEAQQDRLQIAMAATDNESLQEFQLNRQLRPFLTRMGEQAGATKEQIDRVADVTSEFLAAVSQTQVLPADLVLHVRIHDPSVTLTLEVEPRGIAADDFLALRWTEIQRDLQRRLARVDCQRADDRLRFIWIFE